MVVPVPTRSTLFPYTTLFRSWNSFTKSNGFGDAGMNSFNHYAYGSCVGWLYRTVLGIEATEPGFAERSEEHTSELQSHVNLVCRLLLEKKKANNKNYLKYN